MVTEERNEQIMKMRKDGLTYLAIGKELGISDTRVQQLYNKTLRVNRKRALLHELKMDKNERLGTKILHVIARYLGKGYGEIKAEDILGMDDETFSGLYGVGVAALEYFRETKQRLMA